MIKQSKFLIQLLVYTIVFQIGLGSTLPAIAADNKDPKDPTSVISDDAISPATMIRDDAHQDVATVEELTKETETDVKQTYEALEGKRLNSPLDVFRTLNVTAFPYEKEKIKNEVTEKMSIANSIELDNLSVRVVSKQSIPGAIKNEFAVAELYSRLGGSFFAKPGANPTTFEILYRGVKLYEVNIPVTSLAIIDRFIVFTEANTWTPESTSADGQKVSAYQKVSFIDLGFFAAAIGRVEFGVFSMPVEAQAPSEQIEFLGNHGIRVAGQKISPQVLDIYSQANQIPWNAVVNLLLPQTYEQAGPLVDSVDTAWTKAMDTAAESYAAQEGEAVLLRDVYRAHGQQYSEKMKKLRGELATGKEVTAAQKEAMTSKPAIEALERIAANSSKNVAAQKKLTARLALLWNRLSIPRPMGAPEIRTGLAFVAGGLMDRDRAQVKEGVLKLVNHPFIKFGAPVAAAAAWGALSPETASMALYTVFDMGRTVVSWFGGKVYDLVYMIGDASAKTFAGLNPFTFRDAYLSADKFPKFAEGFMALTALYGITMFVPHVIYNSVALARDLWKADYKQYRQNGFGWWGSRRQAFIDRQERLNQQYLSYLAESDAKERGEEVRQYTEAETQEVRAIIAELKKGDKPGMFSRVKAAVMNWGVFKRIGAKSDAKITTLRKAFTHFLVSWESFTRTAGINTRIWNFVFAARSFVWYPVRLALFARYPNYYATITRVPDPEAKELKATVPTHANGAYRPFLRNLALKLDRITGGDQLAALEALEVKIADAEKTLHTEVLKQSVNALIQYSDSEDIQEIYEKGGIRSVTDSTINGLPKHQRIFFRTYYEKLLDESTRRFLLETEQNQVGTLVDENANLDEIKDAILKAPKEIEVSITITPKRAKQIVTEVAVEKDLYQVVRADVSSFWNRFSGERLDRSWRGAVTSKLDPGKNRQLNRIMSVKREVQKPKAMARAVRSSIVKMLVSKPVELGFQFVFLAGITQGILAPLQNEQYGENSWHYLSKAVFLAGFATSMVTSMLADTWMKLQQNEQSHGDFGDVPEGDDANKSYFSWWYKKTFKNPKLSLWKSHAFYSKLIWANMPAALAMMMVTNVITMGRFDVDMYVAGYALAYGDFLGGLEQKVDQGFEQSLGYDLKHFRKELRSHPEVQGYAQTKALKRRTVFSIVYDIWYQTIGTISGTVASIHTSALGSRSLSRWIFGGYSVTEVMMIGMDKMHGALDAVGVTSVPVVGPAMSWAIDKCQSVISNKYTDWEKYTPKKLGGG